MNLETDNPEKGQLLQRSERHRQLLEDEVKQITERSEKMVTNALIIGGALVLTYFLVSSFSGGSGKKKKHTRSRNEKKAQSGEKTDTGEDDQPQEAGMMSQVGAMLVSQATGLLLSIAREKLVEYLQSQSLKKENTDDRT